MQQHDQRQDNQPVCVRASSTNSDEEDSEKEEDDDDDDEAPAAPRPMQVKGGQRRPGAAPMPESKRAHRSVQGKTKRVELICQICDARPAEQRNAILLERPPLR